MADFASEAGHWYSTDGSPAYTLVGKNGKERAATVRDARTLGLLPSVTTIIGCAARPALEVWKAKQLMLAALTLPRLPDEPEEAWLKRVAEDSREQAKKAAEKGTQIHAAIEQHYRGQSPAPEMWPYVRAAFTTIRERCGEQTWQPERSFAHASGYGGKVDLHSTEWVIDYKGKEFTSEDDAPALYDEHPMQLGSYRRGLGVPGARCGILFFSRNEEGLVAFVEAPEETLVRGLAMFDGLLAYWWSKNGTDIYRRAS